MERIVYAVKAIYESGYWEDCTVVINYTARSSQRWRDFYLIYWLGPFGSPEEAEKAKIWVEQKYAKNECIKSIFVDTFSSLEAFQSLTESNRWREIQGYS